MPYFSDPDEPETHVPDEFYDWAKASVLAYHFSEVVGCLSSDVSIISIDLCNALGDAASWLEGYWSTAKDEAHCYFQGDVDEAASVNEGDTLETLAEVVSQAGSRLDEKNIIRIREIAALASQAEALLADNQQQIAA